MVGLPTLQSSEVVGTNGFYQFIFPFYLSRWLVRSHSQFIVGKLVLKTNWMKVENSGAKKVKEERGQACEIAFLCPGTTAERS